MIMAERVPASDFNYINAFERLGFGLFVHFGLYSMVGKGEWYLCLNPQADAASYEAQKQRFNPSKRWAEKLVSVAKRAGCKYITLTTRHHDGFSLYDTRGLSDFDAPHSACGRDLIGEFVEACNAGGIVPFFYHTLLDWRNDDYKSNFPAYIDYLAESIEILSKNYGKIGGFWFDGMWDKPKENWQEDRLYGTIRKYQPKAMIINNTGLSMLGKVGHREIDGVTFERGNPRFADNSDRPRAGEMCQVLNDHWGYAKNDCNYKSVKELIENLADCRRYNCNFLLNTGLKGNGSVNAMDKSLLEEIGKWIRNNKGFIYGVKSSGIEAENAYVLKDGEYYYAVMKDMGMSADPNVQRNGKQRRVKIHANIREAEWLDNGESVSADNGEIIAEPFGYGTSLSVRVLKFKV